MRTRSKVIFAAIIILALGIVGVSLLLNQGKTSAGGLTVDKPAQVKIRFKELVKQFHPDVNGGDRSTEDRLVEVIQSYNYLKSAGFG